MEDLNQLAPLLVLNRLLWPIDSLEEVPGLTDIRPETYLYAQEEDGPRMAVNLYAQLTSPLPADNLRPCAWGCFVTLKLNTRNDPGYLVTIATGYGSEFDEVLETIAHSPSSFRTGTDSAIILLRICDPLTHGGKSLANALCSEANEMLAFAYRDKDTSDRTVIIRQLFRIAECYGTISALLSLFAGFAMQKRISFAKRAGIWGSYQQRLQIAMNILDKGHDSCRFALEIINVERAHSLDVRIEDLTKQIGKMLGQHSELLGAANLLAESATVQREDHRKLLDNVGRLAESAIGDGRLRRVAG
ncbi:MAG: hypothetical protein ABI743_02210, partial [bacterium]